MILRPDEEAAESSKERDRNFRGNVKKGVQTAIGLGTAAIAPSLVSRVMPFLNELIPTDLAMKGISKISPKIGEFLKKGQSMGLDIKEGLQFVKNKMQPKEDRNIVEQYSPDLHQFIDQEIKKGRSAFEAGAVAQSNSKFSDIIKKMVKDHKTPWSNILQNIYGVDQAQGQMQSQGNSQQVQQPVAQMNQQQGTGKGDAALMAILQKIQQSRVGQ